MIGMVSKAVAHHKVTDLSTTHMAVNRNERRAVGPVHGLSLSDLLSTGNGSFESTNGRGGVSIAKHKTSFVVMPIRRDGSPEHAHFQAIYDEILQPTLANLGHVVTRADEIQKSGAITRDIVLALAAADLVVADLTDLNPNVFYELGVRHALRGRGTIMIVDSLRSDTVPFDLSTYRVIKYRGELTGFGKLRQDLTAYLQDPESPTEFQRDNPVHDWIPSLPVNAIESASGSTEGELREKLAKAIARIRQYEDKLGRSSDDTEANASTPYEAIRTAYEAAKEGGLPSDLMAKAGNAAATRDTKEFLAIAMKFVEKLPILPSADEFDTLAGLSARMGLNNVAQALYEHGLTIFPKNKELRKSLLALKAHSDSLTNREDARRQLLADAGISLDDGKANVPEQIGVADLPHVYVAVDALLEDNLKDEALQITKALVDRFPDESMVLRNYARSIDHAGRPEDAFAWFQKSIWCGHPSDASALWFGNHLHNRGRNVDALEAYTLGAILDPDDAASFTQMADEISWGLRGEIQDVGILDGRKLPKELGKQALVKAIVSSISCELLRAADIGRYSKAASRAGMDVGSPEFRARMTLGERSAFARNVYKLLESPLTMKPPA